MSNQGADCRILVLAQTQDLAVHFVSCVKALSRSRNDSQIDEHPSDTSSLSTADASSHSIPWTISNRYYTADVHFETRVVKEFAAHHASGVPAVIYVWSPGKVYKEDVPTLAQKLESCDPEVSLAVRITPEGNPALAVSTTTSEDEDGLDEFLSSHGFEYIDGDRRGRNPTEDGQGFSDEDSSGIPGLPRVIDSLSTILWPSLVQSDSTNKRKSRARELLDWARDEEEDDGLKALVAPSDTDVSSKDDKKKSRMQREMEELERWLEDEDDQGAYATAWVPPEDDSSTALPTPTIRTAHASFADIGFDDDFSDFVGAPMDVQYGQAPGSTTNKSLSSRPERAPYRSLASVDDFSGEGSMFVHHESSAFQPLQDSDEGEDPELPSHEEIEEASKRIFGSHLGLPPPGINRTKTPSPRSAFADLHSPMSQSSLVMDSPSSSFAQDSDEDDDFELGAFDLSRVLGALQGMKEEIAGMSNEDERRKAAARVALGLVYGLQKENERDPTS